MPWQHEVLQLSAEDKFNKQIYRVLNMAKDMIKNHLYALFR